MAGTRETAPWHGGRAVHRLTPLPGMPVLLRPPPCPSRAPLSLAVFTHALERPRAECVACLERCRHQLEGAACRGPQTATLLFALSGG